MPQKIIILDFGSQTTQLIGRRVRELNTYCEIVPYNKFPYGDPDVIGVILSGSPFSVYDEKAFRTDVEPLAEKYPVLGICYGAQMIAWQNGGAVESAPSREYGRALLAAVDHADPLMKDIEPGETVWMSHGDTITRLPAGFEIIASTDDVPCASFRVEGRKIWGVQFHPEVYHTTCGTRLLGNFVNDICGSKGDWSADAYIDTTVAALREQLGDDRVVLGLSGGVDSSVAAVLISRAIGDRLTCIFVDHGLLRKDEFTQVMEDYRGLGLNVVGVDASDLFFERLAGVTEPEKKRKIIGKSFIDVFDTEAHKISDVKWLAQGTIYPDCIESGKGDAAVIKTHHNRVKMPDDIEFDGVIEPLSDAATIVSASPVTVTLFATTSVTPVGCAVTVSPVTFA